MLQVDRSVGRLAPFRLISQPQGFNRLLKPVVRGSRRPRKLLIPERLRVFWTDRDEVIVCGQLTGSNVVRVGALLELCPLIA